MASDSIENLSTEDRSFLPTAEFAAQSNAKVELYAEADKDRLSFWEKQAQALTWEKKWDKTLEWESPYAKWFVGGKLNATVSALDRHIAMEAALHFTLKANRVIQGLFLMQIYSPMFVKHRMH